MRLLRPTAIATLLLTTGCSDPGPNGKTAASTSVTTGSTTGAPGSGTSAATTDEGTSGTSGAGDGGGSTSSSGGTSGAVFLENPDGGGLGVECDVWAQDCPQGDKCMPWANDGGNAWNATKCVPVDANAKQTGDVCGVQGGGVSGIDDCDVGSMCWNADPETGAGLCIELCSGGPATPTCSDSNTVCAIFNDGVLPVCLTKCDPLLSACLENEVCRPDSESGLFVCSNDASGEAGQYEDPCEYGNACDPGLFCANPTNVPGCGASGCCSSFCDLSDADATTNCPGFDQGQECIAWYEPGNEPPGLQDVGFCGIPR
jgi:hypothetical protein